jgi:hypothetical protein
MINWKKNSAWIFAMILCLFAQAQQFSYRCNLDTISKSGFYAIPLTSELSSHLKTDFSDLRIVDNKGQWIPHFVRNSWREKKTSTGTLDLKIISNERDPVSTVIIVENPNEGLLSNFVLRLKNAAAERMASLSGSEDNRNWFIISDSLVITKPGVYDRDENSQWIELLPTHYPFYKITIRNDKKDPLNVLSVSSITGPRVGQNRSIINPRPKFTQIDSGKLSMLHITSDKSYQFDEVRLEVLRPAFYDRVARVYLDVRSGIMNTWKSSPLTEINISSAYSFNHGLPLVKSRDFYVIIANHDNPPLEIINVSTLLTDQQIITYLEKGKSYHLLIDNPEATQPNYDLEQFYANIPEHPQALQIGSILPLKNQAHSAGPHKIGDWWIWITIGIVVLILAYLTWSLTKDMNKKNQIT